MTDPEPAGRRRAPLGSALLFVGGCAVSFLLLEIFLRVVNPFGQRLLGDAIVLPTHTRVVLANRENPRLDPEIVLARNSLGFRGPEPPRDFASALSIVAIGGSTTECRFLTEGKDWPALLGTRLAPVFPRVWVNNAGLDGHSTFGHQKLVEQRMAALRPKVALFLVGVNDVGREDLKNQDRDLTDREVPWLTRLARVSATAALLQNMGRSAEAVHMNLDYRDLDLRALPPAPENEARHGRQIRTHRKEFVRGFRERLQGLVALCRTHRIVPVLLTQPALYGPLKDDVTGVDLGTVEVDPVRHIGGRLAWDVLEAYNDATRDVGRETGVLVIDVGRQMPKSSRLYYDFHHYTNEGAEAVAEIVARELCPALASGFSAEARGDCP